MTPAQKSMAAKQAALARWSRIPDAEAALAPARRGFQERFEREVDPDGVLDPKERAVLADRAKRAHMTRIALKSSQARAKRKGRKPAA
jgi:hypothetical protein